MTAAVVARWPVVGAAVALLVAGVVSVTGGIWIRVSTSASRRRLALGEAATDVGVALVTGAALGLVLLVAQDGIEEDRFAREQRLEDARVERATEAEEERIKREIRRDNIRFVRETAIQPDAVVLSFQEMDLQGGMLQGLDLADAKLAFADLGGADLLGADLTGADLTEVLYSETTTWPEGLPHHLRPRSRSSPPTPEPALPPGRAGLPATDTERRAYGAAEVGAGLRWPVAESGGEVVGGDFVGDEGAGAPTGVQALR